MKYIAASAILSLVAPLFIFGSFARAQIGVGSISGTIKDATGSVIPGSRITLRNGDTQVERTAQTDGMASMCFPAFR